MLQDDLAYSEDMIPHGEKYVPHHCNVFLRLGGPKKNPLRSCILEYLLFRD